VLPHRHRDERSCDRSQHNARPTLGDYPGVSGVQTRGRRLTAEGRLMIVPISYNVRSLFVRKATTIATAFGIALVVFVLASSLMLSNGIKRTLVSTGSPDRAIVLRKGADSELASNIETRTVGVILSTS